MSEANIKNLLARVANDQALQAKISHLKESSSEEFIQGLADLSAETESSVTADEVRAYFQHLASLEISDEELTSTVGGGTHIPLKFAKPSDTGEKKSDFFDGFVTKFKDLAFRSYEVVDRLF